MLPEGITEVRTVEIVGLDLQADGGTHVANTHEVGGIEVIGTRSKGRINKRLEIALLDGELRADAGGLDSVTTIPKIAIRDRLAHRSRSFEISPWTAAADLVGRHPDPIYFGNGAPAIEGQPLERLQWAAAKAWKEVGGSLDYGELEGYLPLRKLIVERMILARDRATAGDATMVTNGSQQGIDLIAKLLLDPGDAIVVEGPTYIGAMQTFDAYEARYLVCPVDEHGLCIDELESRYSGRPIRAQVDLHRPDLSESNGLFPGI